MKNTTLAILALTLSVAAVGSPAMAERSSTPKRSTAAVSAVVPQVAGFVARSGAGYTRQLWKSPVYEGSLRSK